MTANRTSSLLALCFLFCLTQLLANAAEVGSTSVEEIQQILLKLSDKKSSIRKTAIMDLARYEHPGLVALIDAFKLRQLYVWNDDVVILCPKIEGKTAALQDPLTQEPITDVSGKQLRVTVTELKQIRPGRPERGLAENVKSLFKLSSPNEETKLSGVKKCGEAKTIKGLGKLTDLALEKLDDLATGNQSKKIPRLALESALLIRISRISVDAGSTHLKLVTQLGHTKSQRSQKFLEKSLAQLEKDPALAPQIQRTYQAAIAKIRTYQRLSSLLGNLFRGLSLGSVLILMALGLAITFGLMGVINMAHGELMMIGAYTTYVVQLVFAHTPETPNNWYFIFALPASFLASAAVGLLIEFFVVRHLYKRPLESLLATWGVGLILIQIIRLRFGDNIGVNAPSWGRGGIEVIQDLVFPYGRCFIIVICVLSVGAMYYLMHYTKIGLMMRATMQNREMASSLGVNTGFVDRCTFAFGSGIAGIAGYAWTLIGGVTPDMGQTNFIVDSFLVVVTGGVGEIIGVVWAGLGIGGLTKTLEPTTGTIWAKILLLIAVVIFIQFKPSGLFAAKGRLADD